MRRHSCRGGGASGRKSSRKRSGRIGRSGSNTLASRASSSSPASALSGSAGWTGARRAIGQRRRLEPARAGARQHDGDLGTFRRREAALERIADGAGGEELVLDIERAPRRGDGGEPHLVYFAHVPAPFEGRLGAGD